MCCTDLRISHEAEAAIRKCASRLTSVPGVCPQHFLLLDVLVATWRCAAPVSNLRRAGVTIQALFL